MTPMAATKPLFMDEEEAVLVPEVIAPEEALSIAENDPSAVKAELVGMIKAFALTLEFKTAEHITLARDFVNRGKGVIKNVEAEHRPRIQELKAAHTAAIAEEKALIGPIKEAIDIVNAGMGEYYAAEEKRQREEHRKAEEKRQAEIKAKVEALNQRIAAMSEGSDTASTIAKLEAELETDISDSEAEVIRATIRTLESLGQEEGQSVAVLQAAVAREIETAPIAIVAPVEKVKGVTVKKDYEVEVVDMVELCRAIGAGELPDTLVKSAASALKQHAKLNGGKHMPGCRVTQKTKAHTR